jgi:hypothetical protein
MKIISSITDDRRASVVAIDDYDYVYVVDATPDGDGSRWGVHLVVSLGDDIVYDDATHDRAKVDCDPSHLIDQWVTRAVDLLEASGDTVAYFGDGFEDRAWMFGQRIDMPLWAESIITSVDEEF